MSRYKILIAGAVILLLSFSIGVLGTIWGLSYMEEAVDNSAIHGLSTVTTLIERMFLLTVLAVGGSILGVLLIFVGVVKANRNRN